MKKVRLVKLLTIVCSGVLFPAMSVSVLAQSRGTFNGRVVDKSDAVVPGAAITVTNVNTGIERSTTTNSDGLYTVTALEPGDYDVKVEMSGFASSVRKGVTLLSSSTSTLDFSLAVAGTTQEVSVTGETPLIETTQSEVSGSLQTSEVQDLPVLNRTFSNLITLVPGARAAPNTTPTKGAMGIAMSFGGSPGRNAEVTVDGGDNRDDILSGPLESYTLEGIQEFRVLVNEYGAQYGRVSGATVVIVNKSGTNQLHGSAFGFGRNDGMTAIDYFTEHGPNPVKLPYDREQFGGSIGGPIKKDRWFFFGAGEHIKEDAFQAVSPSTYAQALLVKQALPALGLIPVSSLPQPFRDSMYTVKSDYQINAHHSLSVRWGEQINSKANDSQNNPLQADLSQPTVDSNTLWSIVGSETWVIGNNSVNQFLFQSSRYRNLIQTTAPNAPPTATMTFPSVKIGRQPGADQALYQDKDQFQDSFAHQMGKHALKFGGDFVYYPHPVGFLANPSGSGSVTFFDNPSTIINNTNGKYPQGFLTPGILASLTIGSTAGRGAFTGPSIFGDETEKDLRQFSVYVQDDWKLTPRLTLNLGLRYDLDINFFDQTEVANSRVYQFFCAIGNVHCKLPSTPTKDIAPRVGFAWDIRGNGKNVVRGGFGIFFDQQVTANIFNTLAFIPANLQYLSATYVDTAVGKGQLASYVLNVSPLPPGPAPVETQVPSGFSIAGSVMDGNMTDPYNEQFHVGYARQVSNDLMVSADYTHIEGMHETRQPNFNPIEGAWDPTDADQHIPWGTRRFAAQMAAIGQPNLYGGIQGITTDNRSTFDALIVHSEYRRKRATFQATYTMSKAYGWGGVIAGGQGAVVPGAQNQDNVFTEGNWGPSALDERHRVVLAGVFELPWGLQVSPIFQATSARPYTLTAGSDCNADGTNNDFAYINSSTGAIFSGCNPPAGYVPVSVNSQRGAASFNLDARVSKFIKLWSETRKVGLFAEFYDITNRANFGNNFNGNSLSGASFRQPTGYLAGLPTSFSLQLGARFSF